MVGGISEKAIEERAYHIWQREGCPHGRDFEHWVQAQVELEAEARPSTNGRSNGAKAKAPAKLKAAAPRVAAAPKAKAPAKPRAAAKPKK
jgi:hypothetical protein